MSSEEWKTYSSLFFCIFGPLFALFVGFLIAATTRKERKGPEKSDMQKKIDKLEEMMEEVLGSRDEND